MMRSAAARKRILALSIVLVALTAGAVLMGRHSRIPFLDGLDYRPSPRAAGVVSLTISGTYYEAYEIHDAYAEVRRRLSTAKGWNRIQKNPNYILPYGEYADAESGSDTYQRAVIFPGRAVVGHVGDAEVSDSAGRGWTMLWLARKRGTVGWQEELTAWLDRKLHPAPAESDTILTVVPDPSYLDVHR